jgi:hypothetical protein
MGLFGGKSPIPPQIKKICAFPGAFLGLKKKEEGFTPSEDGGESS